VSIATLDDMKALYDGFDLCSPTTSVSMTINGPAPTILAMFLNTAIDQQLDRFREEEGREPDAEEAEVPGPGAVAVRGTVQADILKEDQGQNTCIFSTEFALRCMADVQEWFIEHEVRNFYSVSISGYHIAEAGANPISQLAFTLANGFTYVEAYLARGMDIDDFAPNFSFFFSNGMDAEYTVMGRVARRIWAIAMRDRYGADERSQKLKYHVQTSGRSLHAQEMDFNDIRTTLQALCAIYDNTNSLHTNAYDEAVTTPTEASVRRALAIQMIIDQEWGLAKNENPLQGAAIVDELTDLVEEAVLAEFDRIADRGGVLGAMETGYQRGKIQDESMLYEHRKHDGSLPIIGVNTFLREDADGDPDAEVELAAGHRGREALQLERVRGLPDAHAGRRGARQLARLQDGRDRRAATSSTALMDAVRPLLARCRSPTRSSRSAASTAATSDHGGRHTLDHQLVERPGHPCPGPVPVGSPHDQLRDHGVVLPRHRVAGSGPGVEAHPGAERCRERADRAGRGDEVGRRFLGVDADLDRVAAQLDVGLGHAHPVPGGDPQLGLREVDPGDEFGDGVLHLEAGVHLQEVEGLEVLVEQELAGPGVGVAHLLGDADRRLAHRGAELLGDPGCRRLLDQLLVAALQGAVPLPEVDRGAVEVGQHLDLHVAGPLEVPLQVALAPAEGRLRLAAGRDERLAHLVTAVHDLHAAAAAAEHGLDRDRVAVLVPEGHRDLGIVGGLAGPGHDRDTGGVGDGAGGELVAHLGDGLGRRSDEHEPRVGDGLGEGRVLGQEPVARMDRVGAGTLRGVDDLVDREVRLTRRRGPEQVGLVHRGDVGGITVDLAVHPDAAHAEFTAGARDADRDLTSVGDQHGIEHG
jgi:methylmalonyl-CoA mutase N-terminal domain/subunit